SHYFVYRRVIQPDGPAVFETIDIATVEGTGSTAKVVTASPPWSGVTNFLSNLKILIGLLGGMPSSTYYLVWQDPPVPLPGVITGRVLRTVPPGPGQTNPTFVPVDNAAITLIDTNGQPAPDVGLTHSQPGTGIFTVVAPQFIGGTVKV